MADGTKIEWTDATWNPITGCSVVSPGCTNCYAMKLAGTRLKHHPSRAGLTKDSKAGPVWTGEVRFNRDWLHQPLGWKRRRMIFVCAHGDLFAEGVPDDWIDHVFAVMALAKQHVFQVLTKRPERMREFVTKLTDLAVRSWNKDLQANDEMGERFPYTLSATAHPAGQRIWPLPNVWLGVSVEDQKRADERIPVLLDTPAAIRWISAEPLLGPVDLTWLDDGERDGCRLHFDALSGLACDGGQTISGIFGQPDPKIDWVVAGGESRPGARPMQPDWARSLRDQCTEAGVPFLFKQWGNHKPTSDCNGSYMIPATKKEAGRLLDGIEHNGFPQVRR